MAVVTLLKDESNDYKELLECSGYKAIFVPVLEFSFMKDINFECLKLIEIVVFTSKRAVEAFKGRSELLIGKRIYAVGEATASALNEIGVSQVNGQECNNAINLAKEIERREGSRKTLCFVCGKERLDTLPDYLRKNHWTVQELIVYESKQRNLSENEIKEIKKSDFVVLFSPKGVRFAKDLFEDQKLIAVGETTRNEATVQGLKIDKVMQTPTPEALLNCLLDLEK